MSNKLTLDLIDRLILESLGQKPLEEAEYVTGSRMLPRPDSVSLRAKFVSDAITSRGNIPDVRSIFSVMKGILENPKNYEFDGEMSTMKSKFDRLVVMESFHKLCVNTINRTDRIPLSSREAGFGMEALMISVLPGSKTITGKTEDIIGVESGGKLYSLKFIKQGADIYQSIKYLAATKEENKKIIYMVFFKQKEEEKDTIGFNLRMFHLPTEVLDLAESLQDYGLETKPEDIKYRTKYAKKYGYKLVDKGRKIVIPHKEKGTGTINIRMPSDVGKFMDIALKSIGEQADNLYRSLDAFKESLNSYYGSEGQKKEKELETATKNIKIVNDNFAKATEKTSGQMELPLQENKNKSKKDLDKLIEEVILNKNK